MRRPPFVARTLLAGAFVNGGLRTYAHAAERTGPAEKLGLPNAEELVRFDAAAKVVGGAALALGILPRLAAAGLAASLIPTTLGAHRFWELEDPRERSLQLTHFLKNAGMLGGLLLVALWPRDADAS
jgi:putative oxidoreductase